MIKLNLNENWIFSNLMKEKVPQHVNLPHDAMLTETRIPDLKDGSYTGYFPGGKYQYTKTFFLDQSYKNKKLFLEFEGIYQKSKVYINEQLVGGRNYGYSTFCIDISDAILINQDNVIKVIADNTQTPNSRWYSGSGIYRDVNLFVGNQSYIKPYGIKIKTVSIEPVIVEIEIDAINSDEVETFVEVLDANYCVIKDLKKTKHVQIENAKLWDADQPHLYTFVVKLIKDKDLIDESKVVTGIRTLEWSPANGLLVNGKTVKLRGGCIHHDNGPLGACSFFDAEYRKVKILKEAGFNAVRYAHNPAGSSFLKACDQLGMYVMNETFDTWVTKKTDYDYSLYFNEEYENDIRSMIDISYNHPSVIIYSIGNEITDTGISQGAEISEKLVALCHELDNTRPTTNGFNLFVSLLGSYNFSFVKNETQMDDIVDPYRTNNNSKASSSILFNIVATIVPPIMKYLANPRKIEKIAKGSLAAVDIVGYNYSEYAMEQHHKWYPERIMVSAETYPSKIAENWNRVMKYPFLIGDFMWVAWDYLGEVGVGLPVYGKSKKSFFKPYPCISTANGSIDITGFKDSQAYYSAVVWNQYSKPYIAVRPINHYGEKVFWGNWRTTDAVNSWSWVGQEGKKAEVEIYSKGSYIELVQNGKSRGVKELVDFKATFTTIYEPGELKAISYDNNRNIIDYIVLVSADSSSKLKIVAESNEVKADINSLVYIVVENTDENGIVKMLDEQKVKINVEGMGSLVAVGSGNPMTEESYQSDQFTTFHGRMIAIVRSNGQRGKIKVSASTNALYSEVISIDCV